MSRRAAQLAVVLAAVVGLATVSALVPAYLRGLGFPLDDAWSSAVHARTLVQSGRLESAPAELGTPGASPLWAAVLAVPHLLAGDARAFVLAVKLLGFALHIAAALVLLRALGVDADGRVRPWPLAGALLVAAHPDLISASLAGVETPLATLLAASLVLAAGRPSIAAWTLLSVLGPLTCPELPVVGLVAPAVLWWQAPRRLGLLAAVAVGGAAAAQLAGGLLGASPLGALASAASNAPVWVQAEWFGFSHVLGRFAVADAGLLLLAAAVVAVHAAVARDGEPASGQRAAAALLAGLAFCAVSFAAFPPFDPALFVFQRRALPGAALLIAAMPVLLARAIERLPARPARLATAALLVLLALSVIVTPRLRYRMLAGDARQVDDVGVAIGRQLADARPGDVVWAVGGGAVGYFGRARVLDLAAVSASRLSPQAMQALLDRHPPSYIEVAPGASSVDVPGRRLYTRPYQALAANPVVGAPAIPPRWMVACDDPSTAGRVILPRGPVTFRCADPSARGALATTPRH